MPNRSVNVSLEEWNYAMNLLIIEGALAENGTKLRRKDHLASLQHSFLVIDRQVLALATQGEYLGAGVDARVKLAINQNGDYFALKIIRNPIFNTQEVVLGKLLEITGDMTYRNGNIHKKSPKKFYIAYRYLGQTLERFLKISRLNLLEASELSLKIALCLQKVHDVGFFHNDIHSANIVVDENREPHLIDFGESARTIGLRVRASEEERLADVINSVLIRQLPQYRVSSYGLEEEDDRIIDNNAMRFSGRVAIYLKEENRVTLNNGEIAHPCICYVVSSKDERGKTVFFEGQVNIQHLSLSKLPTQKNEVMNVFYGYNDIERNKIIEAVLKQATQLKHINGPGIVTVDLTEDLWTLFKNESSIEEPYVMILMNHVNSNLTSTVSLSPEAEELFERVCKNPSIHGVKNDLLKFLIVLRHGEKNIQSIVQILHDIQRMIIESEQSGMCVHTHHEPVQTAATLFRHLVSIEGESASAAQVAPPFET